jgi:hypothetical protein
MHMLYNSDSFIVVQFDVPATAPQIVETGPKLNRGGFEIVDKFARKEIFLDGAMAEHFRAGVKALVERESGPDEEELDEFIGRYGAMAQQPVILH